MISCFPFWLPSVFSLLLVGFPSCFFSLGFGPRVPCRFVSDSCCIFVGFLVRPRVYSWLMGARAFISMPSSGMVEGTPHRVGGVFLQDPLKWLRLSFWRPPPKPQTRGTNSQIDTPSWAKGVLGLVCPLSAGHGQEIESLRGDKAGIEAGRLRTLRCPG